MSFFNDIGNAIGNVANAVSNEVSRAFDELGDNICDDIESIGVATTDGGLLAGALEALDVFSPGNVVGETLDAFNVLPEDPALKELVSAGGNLLLGVGPTQLLAIKDIADAVSAIGAANAGKAPPPASSRPGPAQGNERPASVHDARCRDLSGVVGGVRCGYASDPIADRLRERVGPGAGGSVIGGLQNDMALLLERLRALFGQDEDDALDAEIDRILSNPNLTFEDMIFQLLRTILRAGQAEAKGLAEELRGARGEARAERDRLTAAIEDKSKALDETDDPKARATLQREIDALREERASKASDAAESRAEIVEDLKTITQKLSEMQQALSNIMNAMHESAMAAIRNIR